MRFDAARARRFRRRMRGVEVAYRGGRIDDDARERAAASVYAWAAGGDTLAFRRSFLARDGLRSARRPGTLGGGTEDEPAPTA